MTHLISAERLRHAPPTFVPTHPHHIGGGVFAWNCERAKKLGGVGPPGCSGEESEEKKFILLK